MPPCPRSTGWSSAEMERSGVPGVAVAVVYDDEVVFAEGYGVREVGTQDPVSPETVFQLASLSKPITGTALAGLVSDGTISWDEPVHPYAPDLIFSDPWVTDHVTFADLYSHRSGLPGGIGDALEIFGFTRERDPRPLPPRPAEPVPGVVRLHRLRHDGRRRRSSQGGRRPLRADGRRAALRAGRHDLEHCHATPTSWPDPIAPPSTCGSTGSGSPGRSVSPMPRLRRGASASSVDDVATWVRLQLNGGTLDGEEIISEEALPPTHTPQIVKPPAADLRRTGPLLRARVEPRPRTTSATSAGRTLAPSPRAPRRTSRCCRPRASASSC